MFFKNSRYRKQPFTVTMDARGRRFKSVTLRPTPDTAGTFQHTIEEGERLDHLAYKYYKAPRKWWRIMDANQEFFSPLDLLGDGVLQCVRIPLTHDEEAGDPPWSVLAAILAGLVGVAASRFEENVLLSEDIRTVASETIPVASQSYDRAVLIDYNSRTISVTELTAAISSSGFGAGAPQHRGRIGRPITIPPDSPA